MKFVAPVMGPWMAHSMPEYEKLLKTEIDLMKGLVDGLKDFDVDFEQEKDMLDRQLVRGVGEREAEGPSLWALRQMLDDADPTWRSTCALRKILTPENHYLWLCKHHAEEYR